MGTIRTCSRRGLDKSMGRKEQLYGGLNLQSTRAGSTNFFGFVDSTATLGIDSNINWVHRLSSSRYGALGYKFSRLRTEMVPNFAHRVNVAGAAGIAGNDQDAAQWGPPALNFSSGIASLGDAESAFNRNRTDAFSASMQIYHGHHNITAGGDLRKQEYNDLFQQDPRGTFTFTGAVTAGSATKNSGSDLADFLLGVPDTSSIAFGNADKYLRQTVYDAYATGDWRILPVLTINAGLRWEYGAPMTELHGQLVNLDLTSNFSAAAPVLGSNPVGEVTGSHYPGSLVRPDRRGVEPRIGISWRPIPASTLVVRAGYGLYHDTSVYLNSTLQLAQQAPLSKSLSVTNSAACPLTLADGFNPCTEVTADSFAMDPNFRIGYAQTWQVSVQRDLPAALQLVATYLGVKGTHGVQEFLPNTYPIGAAAPCPDCPSGFVYRTSSGNSTRESGLLQLRRRLRSGFTATLLYTYAKSIDDDAYLGGLGHTTASAQSQSEAGANAAIAQNWLNPRAERARSNFDQRHLINLQAQYTSGEGLGGGSLMNGWRGRVLKEWTVITQISAGTGLPETPVYFADGAGRCVHRDHSPHACRRIPLQGEPGFAPECSGLLRTLDRPVGNGGQKLDHRPRTVQPGQRAGTHVSAEPATLTRRSRRRNQPAEPYRLYRLERDHEQYAISYRAARLKTKPKRAGHSKLAPLIRISVDFPYRILILNASSY